MDLKEFRATLLRLDHPEQILQLADTYLTQQQTMGSSFILPKEHEIVKPVLDYYTGDLAGWVKFVKGVRDRLPVDGRKFHAGVHEFYRKLEIRHVQMERRSRLDAALEVSLRKKLIPNTYEDKMRYTRRCTQVWKQRKDNLLKLHTPKTGRITVEEREELLDEFWKMIDTEIQNGEVPKA